MQFDAVSVADLEKKTKDQVRSKMVVSVDQASETWKGLDDVHPWTPEVMGPELWWQNHLVVALHLQ